MGAIIIDVETTGLKEPHAVEVSWVKLDPIESGLKVTDRYTERFNPEKPIELGATATHHIFNDDLTFCRSHREFSLPQGTQYLIGHNVDFDWQVIGNPTVKRICTLALARKYLPGLDSYSLSALAYHVLGSPARVLIKDAHSAQVDVHLCYWILSRLLKEIGEVKSWNHLWELSESARVPEVMPFGKHKGTPIAQLPKDYIRWLLMQSDIDPYLMHAIRNASKV